MRQPGKAALACFAFMICMIGVAASVNAVESNHTNSIGMKFVLIPAGSVTWKGENRDITAGISKSYYLGVYEVTQEQWQEIMGDNPAYFKGRERPLECASWDDIQEFICRLNRKEGHNRYRLPTEAEWEHAARAGTETEYFFGNDEADLDEYAWYDDNIDNTTSPVGLKKPNPWGLYDIYGNVSEWVQDRVAAYPDADVTDYTGASSGKSRGHRGGSWIRPAPDCRSAHRDWDFQDNQGNYIGFRLALTPEE